MDERLQTKFFHLPIISAEASVVPDPVRCIQCGICTYHCPIEIDVRRYAWLGLPITNRHCLNCGECVEQCPRGVLHFERTRGSDRSGSIFARE